MPPTIVELNKYEKLVLTTLVIQLVADSYSKVVDGHRRDLDAALQDYGVASSILMKLGYYKHLGETE